MRKEKKTDKEKKARKESVAARSPPITCVQPSESGSGSILAIAVMASVLIVAGMLVTVSAALVVKQRVVGAADAAALAAADTASGLAPGFPCEMARGAARVNGAELGTCVIEGASVTVTAHATYLGLRIIVAARAGPPVAPWEERKDFRPAGSGAGMPEPLGTEQR